MAEYLHWFSLPSTAEYGEFMVGAFKVQARAGRKTSDKLDDGAGYKSYKFEKHLDRYPNKK